MQHTIDNIRVRTSSDGIPYIRIAEIPAHRRQAFEDWLWDYTRPLIAEESDFFGCADPGDYRRFLSQVPYDCSEFRKLG